MDKRLEDMFTNTSVCLLQIEVIASCFSQVMTDKKNLQKAPLMMTIIADHLQWLRDSLEDLGDAIRNQL